MTLTRRTMLGTAASLAAPGIVQAESARTLRFIPHADLASLDPMWTTADIARNHGNMIYDQLFGLDAGFLPHPQMVAGFRVEGDGTIWDLTLRDGIDVPRQDTGPRARLRGQRLALGKTRRLWRRVDGPHG